MYKCAYKSLLFIWIIYFVNVFFSFFLSDVWPSMVTHTLNLCSAFNPSKCTHTVVNTHTLWTHTWSSGQPMLRRPGSSWGFGALLKGLTSVVVLKVERALDIQSPHDNSYRTRDSNPQSRVTSPTLYPLGHDCPCIVQDCMSCICHKL